jgi:hypothetical protein
VDDSADLLPTANACYQERIHWRSRNGTGQFHQRVADAVNEALRQISAQRFLAILMNGLQQRQRLLS